MNEEKDQKTKTAPTSPPPQTRPFVAPMMDSTSHIEISYMQNNKFSEEIIRDAGRVFGLEKLRKLQGNRDVFLAEAKLQINKMCQSIESFVGHTDLFLVNFQTNLGRLLNLVESTFSKKHEFINWLTTNFGNKQRRYFEQSRQLAGMGDTAVKYRSLGKNRLLMVDHLQKILEKPFEEILQDHPFPDTTEDISGQLFKAHVDTIITYYRFKDAGIANIKFEQAAQMASYEHQAVEVKTVKAFKKAWDEGENKDAILDRYVMDKMAGIGEEKTRITSGDSLNRLLAMLNGYFETRLNDPDWLKEQRELLDQTIFYKAYGNLNWLRNKLNRSVRKSKKSRKEKGK